MENEGCEVNKEKSPISSALGQLDNNIDVLSRGLDKLASLIQPVMRDSEPLKEGASAAVAQPSPIGQQIQKAAVAINGMTKYVQDLQDRIQL